MAKIKIKDESTLLRDTLSILVPKEYLDYFELAEVRNKPDCYDLILVEKETCVPDELKEQDIVLDGYCNPISILGHGFSLKPIYLVVKRRRWKIKGTDNHYSNSYELHEKGLKLTPQYVAFLKEYNRITGREY